MLIQKYEANKAALMEIGRDALAERVRLGLPLSDKEKEMSRAFTFDGRPQPLVTDFATAELRAEALRRLYPEHLYEVVPGGGAWRIAQQDSNGNFESWVES